MMRRVLLGLLCVPVLVVALGLFGVSAFVLSLLPAPVTVVTVCLIVVVVLWLVLGRRREPAAAGTESRFLSQPSKEGLL